MKPPVRGNKKVAVQPVIITNENKFTPKISERTIQRKQKARDRQLNPGIFPTKLSVCGCLCLYIFLILCIVIGAGGIVLCVIYFNADQNTQVWKIVGIALGVVVCLIGIILILLSIFKQTRGRPWKSKKSETLVNNDNDYVDDIEDFDGSEFRGNIIVYDKNQTRETASSPIPNSLYTSKPMYNNPMYQPEQASVAIQTTENKTHTIIDRSKKSSMTTETQTKSRSNTPDSVILRRVPIPTTKVVVQKPATKVMIVRVPNKAGELIVQPVDITSNE
ncbi:unnamed protein product [Adineta steineri]|uniref:Uncharacterized protein n=1 Tax=Adineta steineri TaxID=433720 RepID=A0A818GEH1_9BILA|nr:unnamed protein product [Adineta steineri]